MGRERAGVAADVLIISIARTDGKATNDYWTRWVGCKIILASRKHFLFYLTWIADVFVMLTLFIFYHSVRFFTLSFSAFNSENTYTCVRRQQRSMDKQTENGTFLIIWEPGFCRKYNCAENGISDSGMNSRAIPCVLETTSSLLPQLDIST